MTEPTTPPADVTVMPNDVVNVPTKSAYKSSAIYGLAVILIDAAIVKWVRPSFQDAGQAAAVEALDWLIPILLAMGSALVAWGRTKAAQPLHWLAPTSKAVKIKALIPFTAAVLALCSSGCASLFRTTSGEPMSMASRVYLAVQTHKTLKDTANDLISAGVITDQPTKDAIWYTSEEVRKAIEAADAKIAAGDKVGFNDVMAGVQSALDRLATINAKHNTPTPGADLWIPRR